MGFPLRFVRSLLIAAASVAVVPVAQADYSISNNLSATSGGTESATGTTYLAAGFGSSTGGLLSSVTLNVGASIAGTAELDIYTDNGLQPGSMVGTKLTQSGSITASPTNVTWTASGITLAANTNYWVVLKALTGQFDWSWTAASSGVGTGAGYQGTWAEADDAGATWFSYDSYPTQMNVVLTSAATVPEPSTLVLWGLGFLGVATYGRLNRRKAPAACPVVG